MARRTIRVELDFTPEALERVDALMEKLDADSRADVIRRALKLYEWFVFQVDRENIIEIQDRKNKPLSQILAYELY